MNASPPAIHFDNEVSPTRTVIDIEAEDRLGLLYYTAQVFAELNLDISVAKISTEKRRRGGQLLRGRGGRQSHSLTRPAAVD